MAKDGSPIFNADRKASAQTQRMRAGSDRAKPPRLELLDPAQTCVDAKMHDA